MAQYKIFVSHAWNYDDDMERLSDLLNSRMYYIFEFTEFRKHNAVDSINSDYIMRRIRENIQKSNVFLAIAGVYASYSDWMEYEMRMAKYYGLKIIGIKPYGNQYTSSKVSEYADEIVNWNTESIVAAISRNRR